MKNRLIAGLATGVFVLGMSGMPHAATFNSGDSGTFSFSSLPYMGIGNINDMDTTWINFSTPTIFIKPDGSSEYIPFLAEDASFQINLFENNDDVITRNVQVVDGLNGPPLGIGFVRPVFWNPDGTISYGSTLWEDLEGKLTLTMLSGSMNLDFLHVEVHAGGHRWGQSFEVSAVPIPIPGAVWLLGSGLTGLVGWRRKIGQITGTGSEYAENQF